MLDVVISVEIRSTVQAGEIFTVRTFRSVVLFHLILFHRLTASVARKKDHARRRRLTYVSIPRENVTPDMKLLPLLLSILTAARCISAQTTTFHLSPNGNDSNTGSADQPWKSLSRSLQGIRDLKKAHGGTLPGPVDVIFQAGMYDANNDATVTFDASVSGGETTPITFQSASADAVRTGTF